MERLLVKLEALRRALNSLERVIGAIDAQDSQGADLWVEVLDEVEALAESPYAYGLAESRKKALELYDSLKLEYRAVYGQPLPERLRQAFAGLFKALGIRLRRIGNMPLGDSFAGVTITRRNRLARESWVMYKGRPDCRDFDEILIEED